jgi:transposase-like protein
VNGAGSKLTRPVPPCSHCGGDHVKRDGKTENGGQRYRCERCGTSMVEQKGRKTSGSGVIAGKIEIGRGSFWGAGRA